MACGGDTIVIRDLGEKMDEILVRFEGKVLTASELERFLYMENRTDGQLHEVIESQQEELSNLQQQIDEAETSYSAYEVDEAFDEGADKAIDKMKTFILNEIVKLEDSLKDADPAEKFDLLLFGVNDIINELQVDDIDLGFHYH